MSPPPLPVAPPMPNSSAVTAGWICVAIGMVTFWIFGLGFTFFGIAMICAAVAMCTNQVQRGLILLPSSLASLAICAHFLRRYLWCDVRGTWDRSSESPPTADSFCVTDALASPKIVLL